MDSVGERIKEIRTSKGITQADLADALDTTTAAISRYEQGKRAIQFPQAKAIADFMGVSVFELYGISTERQVIIKEIQGRISFVKEKISLISEKYPDGSMQGMIQSLQGVVEILEKQVQDEIGLAVVMHEAQIRAAQITQSDAAKAPSSSAVPDLTIKRRNKRVDNLVSIFSSYSDDIQNRILDVVSAFGQLNSVGQKHAVGRIKELTQIPAYQATRPDIGGYLETVKKFLSLDEIQNLENQLHIIYNQLSELDLMSKSRYKNKRAVASSCTLIENAMKEITHVMLKRFRSPDPEREA